MSTAEQVSAHLEVKPATSTESGFFGEYLAGWALSSFSPTFYYQVGRRPVWRAVLFFLTFMAVLTVLVTAGLAVRMIPVKRDLAQAFSTGQIPELTVSNGRLSLHGANPYVVNLGYGLIVVDTTGRYTDRDMGAGPNDVAILLTATGYVSYEDGTVQHVPWSDIQAVFGDQPLEFNAATLYRWLDILVGVVFVGAGLFFPMAWLAYVAFIGLLVWGIASLIQRGAGFRHVLIAGLYAIVPGWYGYRLAGIILPGTSLLVLWVVHTAAWVFGLICMLHARQPGQSTGFFGVRPLRPWRTLVALPSILLVHASLFVDFTETYRWVTLALWLVSIVVLAWLSLRAMLHEAATADSVPPAAPP